MRDNEYMECGGKVRVADGDAALVVQKKHICAAAVTPLWLRAKHRVSTASGSATNQSAAAGGALQRTPWPHAPLHQLSESGTYFVTVGAYHKEHHFRGADRLRVLHRGLLKTTHEFGWRLEAWAVFSNHYHFVAHSPMGEDGAQSLSRMLGLLHETTAKWLNRLDHTPGRQVWHNFRETRLTYEKSSLARLNYVHQNPVKHGLILVASQYP